jgi:hypothetical protein
MMTADTSSAMNESNGACEEGTAEAGRERTFAPCRRRLPRRLTLA